MNNVFTAKLLQTLNNKKGEKGFTLIELLVVVIIIGVLAAVALPNLLGQVGKARESEAKTALGALNRGQQAYHLEASQFYAPTAADIAAANADGKDDFGATESALGVVPGREFYLWQNNTDPTPGAPDDLSTPLVDESTDPPARFNMDIQAFSIDPDNDGTRDFAAGANFGDGAFRTMLCVSNQIPNNPAPNTRRSLANLGASAPVAAAPAATTSAGQCTGGILIK